MPVLDSLPKQLGELIKEIDSQALGRGKTYKCRLHNGHSAYLKTSAVDSAEFLALTKLNEISLASSLVPEVLAYSRSRQLVLLSAVSGKHPTKDHLSQNLPSFCEQLAQVHLVNRIAGIELLDIPKLLSDLDFLGEDDSVKRALKQVQDYSFCHRDVGLLHGDLYPTNIMASQHDWYFIDWEFCVFGDVKWDLATVSVEFGLTQSQTHQLLLEYQNRNRIELDDGEFDMWRKAYLLVCLGWSLRHDQPCDNYRRLLKQLD